MKHRRIRTLARCLLVTPLLLAAGAGADEGGRALVLDLKGVIGPATSDFTIRGIERAEREGMQIVVLRTDTPGGLDTSMREIIHKILASKVPVVTYVAPQGSRAASAGTYILYASHVAAMAPATNLGAATPVQISPGGLPGAPKPGAPRPGAPGEQPESGDGEPDSKPDSVPVPGTAMERKIVNDAVAYIRGLALERGRNAEWAEKAVREGASLTAEDALQEGVIDIIAGDLETLLAEIDGREVKVGTSTRQLATRGLSVEIQEPDWRNRLLAILTNPNVAYILMLLGIYGLFFELSNPGNVLPGVAGAICLLLALYAFHVLPVNYAGMALMALGLAFIVAEAFAPSFGALGIGGGIAFVIGSLILMDTDIEEFTISVPLVLVVAVTSGAFLMGIVTMGVRQRAQPVVSGIEHMVGGTGEAMDAFEAEGNVRMMGEIWTARTSAPVSRGQRVRIRAVNGLMLEVSPLDTPEEES